MKTKILMLTISSLISFGASAGCDTDFVTFKYSKGVVLEMASVDDQGNRISGKEEQTFLAESVDGIAGTYKLSPLTANLKNGKKVITVDNQMSGETLSYNKVGKLTGTLSFISLASGKCAASYTGNGDDSAIGNPRTIVSTENADLASGRRMLLATPGAAESSLDREIKIIGVIK